MTLYVGIDPGLKGGLAILPGRTYVPKAAIPMPVLGGEVDGGFVSDWLKGYAGLVPAGDLMVCIEKVHSMPKQGVASTFKFGKGYGILCGVCSALHIPYVLVTPQAWKKSVLAGTVQGKDEAIAWVRAAHPEIELIQPRCHKPHDGCADAVCIAEFARRHFNQG